MSAPVVAGPLRNLMVFQLTVATQKELRFDWVKGSWFIGLIGFIGFGVEGCGGTGCRIWGSERLGFRIF